MELAKQTARKHEENIQNILEHRLQVARMQGNENLLHQLEAEMKEYNQPSEPEDVKINLFGLIYNRFKLSLS